MRCIACLIGGKEPASELLFKQQNTFEVVAPLKIVNTKVNIVCINNNQQMK